MKRAHQFLCIPPLLTGSYRAILLLLHLFENGSIKFLYQDVTRSSFRAD